MADVPAKLYFPRQEFENLGLSEPAIRALEQAAFVGQLIIQQGNTDEVLDQVNEDLEDAALSIFTLDARLDPLEADAPYVSQDQTAAWAAATGTEARTALASYAGQTVSNPPTQAEMQTLDNAVKAISQHLVALINDLRSNGALHE